MNDGLEAAREANWRECLWILLIIFFTMAVAPAVAPAEAAHDATAAGEGDGPNAFRLAAHRTGDGWRLRATEAVGSPVIEGDLSAVVSSLQNRCPASSLCSVSIDFQDSDAVSHTEARRFADSAGNALGLRWRISY